MTIPIAEMKQILNDYDIFLIDLWGVIHDGTILYPDSIQTLNLLKSYNKKVIFFSNGPRRANKAKLSLKNMGIDENLYFDVMTSGELLYTKIRNLYSENTKFFYIGPECDADLFNGLNYHRTFDLHEASFILNCGLFDASSGYDKEESVLQKAKELDIPMLCPNPDIIVITQSGKEFFCAGYVAQQYENLSGKVSYFGKPFYDMYHNVFNLFNLQKDKTLAIGDSLHTDITGANNFGIDNVFISGGIHSNELKTSSLDKIFNKYKQRPNFYLDSFK
ncbi:MAG: TIGR01459 family HAD-type hydrolase [Alphaproteobacteria bacterium]